MRNNKFFIGLCLIILACNARDHNPISKVDFSQEWKSDSTGCLGKRKIIVEEKLDQIRQYIGKPQKDFIEAFGTPFGIKESKKGTIMFYWITCSKIKVDNMSERIDPDATQLAIDINDKLFVENIRLMVP